MIPGIDFDHTSLAVHDLMDSAHELRRRLGAAPVIGEAGEQFRYLSLRVGPEGTEANLELIDPIGDDGFLSRFLAKHGEGPHHITFTVPNLRTMVQDVQSLGLTVVGENFDDPVWQEAFLVPDAVHGTVIQLAQTDKSYVSVDATAPEHWWNPLWQTPPETSATLGATHLASTDPSLSHRLFADVLGGEATDSDDGVRYVWPNGSLHVRPSDRPGLVSIDLVNGPADGMTIGSMRLG
jgi:catechol 2,3-dioxygenase-like lactoylglutathione lyase family enzyme